MKVLIMLSAVLGVAFASPLFFSPIALPGLTTKAPTTTKAPVTTVATTTAAPVTTKPTTVAPVDQPPKAVSQEMVDQLQSILPQYPELQAIQSEIFNNAPNTAANPMDAPLSSLSPQLQSYIQTLQNFIANNPQITDLSVAV